MCGFTGCVSFKEIDEIKLEKSNKHSEKRPDNTSNIKGQEEIFLIYGLIDLNCRS